MTLTVYSEQLLETSLVTLTLSVGYWAGLG